jgi:lysozyme
MQVTYRIALEVASHEAIIRQAYKDSVGVWTWSVGLTSATGHDVTRYIDKPAPLSKCLEVYVWALDRYADAVREVFAGYDLTEAQFAAALSFHWNTGAIKRASWVKSFKAGDMAGAKARFMNWVTPKSITARRAAERDLFFSGKWNNDGTMTEYTRLTASHTPVWSSAKKINVKVELLQAFEGPIIIEDQPAQPDAPVTQPTITPSADPENNPFTPITVPSTTAPTPKAPVAGPIAAVLALIGIALAKANGVFDYIWSLFT